MSLAPLRDALAHLHRAFYEPDIIRGGQDVTVELPYEAGLRFELYLREHAPVQMRCDPNWLQTNSVLANGVLCPMRSVTIDGVKLQWPVTVLAVPGHPEGRPRPSAV